jgi:hypothetical protein
MPLRVSGVPPDLEMTSTSVLVEAGRDLGEHRVHAGGVGVVEEEDRHAGVLADGLGDELRSERRAADADEQDLLEISAVGWRDHAGVDFHGEVLELRERAGDRLFQLRRGGEVRVSQPVMADHPAFVGVGDGTAFERLHVGEGLVGFSVPSSVKNPRRYPSARGRGKSRIAGSGGAIGCRIARTWG